MRIAVVQMTSGGEPQSNLEKIHSLLRSTKEIQARRIDAVFLPECFYSLSNGKERTPYLVEQGNEHYQAIQGLAQEYGVYLLGGSASTLLNGKVLNRAYNFAPDGTELNFYDKIHLFSCDLSNHVSKKVVNESLFFTAGTQKQLLEVRQMHLGLSICFDVRFPEQARWYSRHGANTLSYSSSFTVPTGRAHWHTLLRARAIENQCYVIAAAQWGKNHDTVTTYGHSLIIDPWGEVLADAGEGEKVLVQELNFELVNEVRKRMNVLCD